MTKHTKADEPKPLSLSDDDVTDVERTTRRGALAKVGALFAGAVFGAAALSTKTAEACDRVTGRTDSDSGASGDSPNHGRTNVTDSDPQDGASCGRGSRARGRTSRPRSCTDSDSGPRADGAGRGRRCAPRRPCTDSDTGANGDQPNRGRHC
jgi:hypothetical protein